MMEDGNNLEVPFSGLKQTYQENKDLFDSCFSQVSENAAFIGNDQNSFVKNFEDDFKNFLGAGHVVGCANGSDAIELVLRALDIGIGDEVLVPAMTWVSTASMVSIVGATPVFVDNSICDYNLDIDLIANCVSPRTKAVIAVHLYGQPANILALKEFCENRALYLIEDCAQSHGAKVGSVHCGCFGVAGTFSFFPSKNLGGFGDSGCIVSNSDQLVEKLRLLRNHGQLTKNDHLVLGRNSRLDGLQAAILSAKMSLLNDAAASRIAVAEYYQNNITNPLIILPTIVEARPSVFHQFVIRTKYRDELAAYLKNNYVETAIHYPNILPDMAIFSNGIQNSDYPIARLIAREGLSLPIFPELTKIQMEKVVRLLNEFKP